MFYAISFTLSESIVVLCALGFWGSSTRAVISFMLYLVWLYDLII